MAWPLEKNDFPQGRGIDSRSRGTVTFSFVDFKQCRGQDGSVSKHGEAAAQKNRSSSIDERPSGNDCHGSGWKRNLGEAGRMSRGNGKAARRSKSRGIRRRCVSV